MKRGQYTPEKILGIIEEAEASGAAEACRRHGVSRTTLWRWQAKYAGMEVTDVRRLGQVEEENRRLKRLLADAMLDNRVLKDLLGKK